MELLKWIREQYFKFQHFVPLFPPLQTVLTLERKMKKSCSFQVNLREECVASPPSVFRHVFLY